MEEIAKKYFKVVKLRVPYPARTQDGDIRALELTVVAPRGYGFGCKGQRRAATYDFSFAREYWFDRLVLIKQ